MITQKIYATDIEDRIDPYYYQPEFIEIKKKLEKLKLKKIKDISINLKNGSTPKGGVFEGSGIPYFRSQDFDLFDLETRQFITPGFHKKLSRSAIKANDILVAVVGATLGVVGYVPDEIQEGNINQNVARIRIKDNEINPKYLAIFLASRIGQKSIFRNATITTQAYLNNQQLGEIEIPVLERQTQNKIVELITTAYQIQKEKLKQADELLNSVDETVLVFLNITMPQKQPVKTFVVNLKTEDRKRLDPRYHQPFFNQFEKQLGARQDTKKLTEISSYIGSGATPRAGGSAYVAKDEGIPFIRITNIKNNTIVIDNDTLYIKKKIHEGMLKRTILQPNDILLSMAGTIGISVVVPHNLGEANINQALARVVVVEEVNPRYVSAILNSPIGKVQTDRLSRPSVQANINLQEIGELKIPLPHKQLQDEIVSAISEKVGKADNLRIEAEEILRQAKKKVEEMILN